MPSAADTPLESRAASAAPARVNRRCTIACPTWNEQTVLGSSGGLQRAAYRMGNGL